MFTYQLNKLSNSTAILGTGPVDKENKFVERDTVFPK